jgi:hypothetical protein
MKIIQNSLKILKLQKNLYLHNCSKNHMILTKSDARNDTTPQKSFETHAHIQKIAKIRQTTKKSCF